jgi:ketosteroid isomerase-like protein
MSRKHVLVALVCAAGIGVSLAAKAQGNADEQAIRNLDKEWSAAAGSKDAAKTVSFYASDASAFPFNAPIATGKERIEEMWAHLMALPGFALSFAPSKIEVAKGGDLAYDVGTFELKVNDAQGNRAITVGKYVVVWKKQADAHWKVVADIFNTDK